MTHDTEKEFVEQVEHVEKALDKDHLDPNDLLDSFDSVRAAKVRHMIDWRLIPALSVMYSVSLMDRKNVSNAAIAGMLTDLHLKKGPGYNLVNMCFFITYVIFQFPMVVLCRKMGPRVFLPACCILWGIIIIGFGFSQNWVTLIPLRLILGVLESGYFPGCCYLLSCWYTKFEVGKRYSVFYLVGCLASALSGILAYGLQHMEGVQGVRGWRWIFIMEGVITVGVALFSMGFVVKFPDEERKKPSWGFLSRDNLDFVIARLNADRGDVEPDSFTWRRFLQPATEWYIYGFPFILFMVTTTANAFTLTLPIILNSTLGFSVGMSQCMGAPPYVFSGILMLGAGWYSDRYKTRGPVLCFLCLVSLIGLPIMGFAKNPWAKYAGVFITVSGTNSAIPSVMAYQANNIRGQWRRAFCSAALTGLGGIGGIAGALVFRVEDSPGYVPGFIACIVANVLVIVAVGIMSMYFRRCNKQADRGERILLEDPTFRFTI